MVFGKVAAARREEVAKSVDMFGVDIRGMERGDLLGKGQIHFSRGSPDLLEKFKGRLLVVKVGSQRALAEVQSIPRISDHNWAENAAVIEVKYLTGSKAGETERIGHAQILEFPSFGKVFKSIRRGQGDTVKLDILQLRKDLA